MSEIELEKLVVQIEFGQNPNNLATAVGRNQVEGEQEGHLDATRLGSNEQFLDTPHGIRAIQR